MIPSRGKRLLPWLGSGLAVLGAGFVAARLVSLADQISLSRVTAGTLIALLGMSAAYGAANLLLALAWRDVLWHQNVPVDARWAVRTYGVTQLAKYVPGNIFHLAGRQAIGQAAGLPAVVLVKSAAWELGLISFVGTWFLPLAAIHFWPWATVAQALTALAAVAGVSILLTHRCIGHRIARCLAWHLAFLSLSGSIFAVVLWLAWPVASISPSWALGACGASVVAWLAGLLTPGAPAGVGVREFVLLSLLRPFAPEAGLIEAIVLGRIVSVTGDLLFYLFAGMMPAQPVSRRIFAISATPGAESEAAGGPQASR